MEENQPEPKYEGINIWNLVELIKELSCIIPTDDLWLTKRLKLVYESAVIIQKGIEKR